MKEYRIIVYGNGKEIFGEWALLDESVTIEQLNKFKDFWLNDSVLNTRFTYQIEWR